MGTPRTWVRVGRVALLTGVMALTPLAVTPALAVVPTTTTDAGPAAAGWIAAQVEAGGLTPAGLTDAIFAFAAAGVGANAAATALTQLEASVDSYIYSGPTLQAGPLGKVLLAVTIAGGDVHDFGAAHHDLEAELRGLMAATGPDAGRFGSAMIYDQSLDMLALATTASGIPADAGTWLASKQCPDGDYQWDGACPGFGPDPDSTAIALQALKAAGDDGADTATEAGNADTWLLAQQAPDGSLSSFGTPNSSSTAAAAQAYRTMGHTEAADKAAAYIASLPFGCGAAAANVGAIPWADGGTDFLMMSTPQAVVGMGSNLLYQLSITGATPTAPTLACPTAPTGATAVAGAGSATVTWDASPDGASPITAYIAVSSPGAGSCTPTPRTATTCTVHDLADGKYTFSVVAVNALGVSPASAASNRVTIDTTAPVVKAPAVTMRVGRQLSGVNVPVAVTWSGSDALSGIASFGLERSSNGGTSYSAVSLSPATATSRLTTLAAGTTGNRFRTQATDASGNTSAWVAGPSLAVSLVDDATAKITYRGTWTTSRPASASGTTLHSTTARNASASIAFTGRGIAWVAPKGTSRGKAALYLDGKSIGTVNLNATAVSKVLVYAKSWSSSGAHTLRIVALGTAGHPRVDVDAFVIVK